MSKYMDDKRMFLEPSVSQYGSRMVMTNVHKPTKKKYWNIDTQFCSDYSAILLDGETQIPFVLCNNTSLICAE